MRSQHTQSAQNQSDWDRSRNEADPQRTSGLGSDYGRPYPRSAPEQYPESHYQSQSQRDHPGIEYFGGSGGYGGGRNEYSQQPSQGQGSYGSSREGYGGGGGGSWSRAEPQSGYRQQEAFQPGGRQSGGYGGEEGGGRFGREDFGRGGYGGYGREQEGQYGPQRQSQSSQYGRGEFEEQPFRPGSYEQQGAGWGEGGRWTSGYGQYGAGQGGSQGGQSQGYGGQQRSQFQPGYGGYQGGQPSGSYGSYQTGSQQPGAMARSRRGPKDYVRSDERIRELICENLSDHPAIDASEVSVQVNGGRVVLEGTVPQRRMKHEIEDVADSCWGVKDVENHIRVQSGQESASGSSFRASSAGTNMTDMSPTETSAMGATGGSATGSAERSAGTESKGKGKEQENR